MLGWRYSASSARARCCVRAQRDDRRTPDARDLDALMGLPAVAYDASEKVSTRATSISMVRYRGNDYSVPVAYAHHEVQVRVYVDKVVIGCGAEVVARHRRSYEKADMVFDPMRFLPLLEQKPGALGWLGQGHSGTEWQPILERASTMIDGYANNNWQ